ncbi:MAG: four helix bundle protein [Verrucomicrobia bacterium]|nr:four helix bundle protein [Verrucomicrobiota bacterium]
MGSDTIFDHEKLQVYRLSLEVCTQISKLLETVPKKLSLWDQLDRASTSISLNLAEGNGRYRATDRCRFFDIARGSALERATALDVLVSRGLLEAKDIVNCKSNLARIVSMIVGLIRSNAPNRVHEDRAVYGTQEAPADSTTC